MGIGVGIGIRRSLVHIETVLGDVAGLVVAGIRREVGAGQAAGGHLDDSRGVQAARAVIGIAPLLSGQSLSLIHI